MDDQQDTKLPDFMTAKPTEESAQNVQDPQPQVVSSPQQPSTKRSFPTKKFAFGLAGILLLIVGVGAGVVLVQQQQNIREEARGLKCSEWADPGTTHCNTDECQQYTCGSDGHWIGPQGPGVCSTHPDCSGGGGETQEWEYITFICDQCSSDYRCQTPDIGVNPYMIFGNQPGDCNQVDRRPKGSTTENWEVVTLCKTTNPCTSSQTSPTPTPTLPPEEPVAAQCLNILAYTTSWQPLSAEDLASLSPGDEIRFTVSGVATSGTIDTARFTINEIQMDAVTQKKPGTNEFYQEYTIPDMPAGQTSLTITVRAEIHHDSLGWF